MSASGARTLCSRKKKGGADRVFTRCNTFRSHRASSEECVHDCDLAVQSRYTAEALRTIEITGSLRCSSSPLSESALICSIFSPRRLILFLYPSVSRVSRGCWAEQPQSCSSSSFKERHFSYSPEFWSQSCPSRAEDGSAGLSFSLDSLRLERLDANGPGLLRAGPSGEERCTPHHMVPVSPQCPQEIGLPTLPVFQGAAVSSERFSLSLPPRNVSELGGSPPLWGSLEQLDRLSPAGHRANRSKYTSAHWGASKPLAHSLWSLNWGYWDYPPI